MNVKRPISLHCPRCGNTQLIVHEESFDCTKCGKEFEIRDLEQFDDDQILSIDEKKRFFEDSKNNN